jgi:hypothetical protein
MAQSVADPKVSDKVVYQLTRALWVCPMQLSAMKYSTAKRTGFELPA